MEQNTPDFLLRVYELYNRYGIKSVTMDDVSRELGISKKTLYECIKDKTDLVRLVMEMVFRYHSTKLYEITTSGLNAIEELFMVNRYMAQMLKDQNPTLLYDLQKYFPTLHKELMNDQRARMHESIRTNLEKGIKEGLYRKDLNINVISHLHMSRMEYRYRHDIYSQEEIDSAEVMREIFIYHMHGIANENGIKIFDEKLKTEWT